MKHSFKESYGILQKHAQTLREQTEPNIDDLLQIVEESVAAYKHCQARIDAVEQALEKALGPSPATTASADTQDPPRSSVRGKPRSDPSARDQFIDDTDGDIPF